MVWFHRFAEVCEGMGEVLIRSSFSANIKERRDLSCALFLSDGRLFAQAAHIPVHLGSMPLSLRAILKKTTPSDGDVVFSNDPFDGGTHLSDVTVVTPIHSDSETLFYAVNRAHHSDVGGAAPGSLLPAREIFQEGIVIPPSYLLRKGRWQRDVMRLFCANTRSADEREGDLRAQVAANRYAAKRMREIVRRYGKERVIEAAGELIEYTERRMSSFIETLPEGVYEFTDRLDDDGVSDSHIPISVAVRISSGRVVVDFGGTSEAVEGSLNCPFAVTVSAVMFVFCSLLGGDVFPNEGVTHCIEIRAPRGSLLSAEFPSAVSSGNVETSQRIVDVLLGALSKIEELRIPAASAGTMCNFSVGGRDDCGSFAYYETVGGGAGAAENYDGASGIQTHMTNTLNTPVEAIELRYPLRVNRYGIRRGSGGEGRFRGGDGVVREFLFLCDCTVSLVAERHRIPPYGLAGGGSGRCGSATLITPDGKRERLPSKMTVRVKKGTVLRVVTPGGGGYGEPEIRTEN